MAIGHAVTHTPDGHGVLTVARGGPSTVRLPCTDLCLCHDTPPNTRHATRGRARMLTTHVTIRTCCDRYWISPRSPSSRDAHRPHTFESACRSLYPPPVCRRLPHKNSHTTSSVFTRCDKVYTRKARVVRNVRVHRSLLSSKILSVQLSSSIDIVQVLNDAHIPVHAKAPAGCFVLMALPLIELPLLCLLAVGWLFVVA